MKLPCVQCIALPVCSGKGVNILRKECGRLKTYISKRKGMTKIVKDVDSYTTTLRIKNKNPLLSIECLYY